MIAVIRFVVRSSVASGVGPSVTANDCVQLPLPLPSATVAGSLCSSVMQLAAAAIASTTPAPIHLEVMFPLHDGSYQYALKSAAIYTSRQIGVPARIALPRRRRRGAPRRSQH